MYNLRVQKRALADMRRLTPKIYRQIALKIFALQFDPRPHDSKQIAGGRRVDSGEYRIYYEILEDENLVSVELIGKRGDDEVYKRLIRLRRRSSG